MKVTSDVPIGVCAHASSGACMGTSCGIRACVMMLIAKLNGFQDLYCKEKFIRTSVPCMRGQPLALRDVQVRLHAPANPIDVLSKCSTANSIEVLLGLDRYALPCMALEPHCKFLSVLLPMKRERCTLSVLCVW